VVEKLEPEPDDGLPPVAVHAKVTGRVPPVADAVQLTAVPTVPVVGQVIVTVMAVELTVMVAEFVAVFALASVTVTETVSVPEAVNVVENVADVAVVLATLLTDQA
jgi:hypothetical protein